MARNIEVSGARLDWVDVARGIGIILVVYGHVLRGLLAAGLITTSDEIWKSDHAIYSFHMPLFFVLAGLNVRHSYDKGRDSFIKAKVLSVGAPYLFWSVVQSVV